MQFSSSDRAFEAWQSEMKQIDIDSLGGEAVLHLLDNSVPKKNWFDGFMLALSARAVATNQHNVDGARSGAAWIAEQTGVSEQQARAELAVQKTLEENPDVRQAVKSGEISLSQATVIGRAAEGDADIARDLLDSARAGDTVDELKRKVQEERAKTGDREATRRRQFVNLHQNDDGLQRLELALIPELAVPIAEAYRKSSGATGWERAESFAELLAESGGSKGSSVVFHVDLTEDFEIKDVAHLKGFGPVPTQAAIDIFEKASFSFVGNIKNKLTFFSEEDRTSKTRPLPEFVKRAVKAKAYDRCEKSHCTEVGAEVDHTMARTNGGDNQLFNLQLLCEPDHDAKTRKDAPWTAGGIYGKHRDTG